MDTPTPSSSQASPIDTSPALWENTIDSWGALLGALDAIVQFMPNCVYRGQGDYDWRLVPSINRYVSNSSAAVAARVEEISIRKFMAEAHAHLPPTSLPRDPYGLDVFDNYVQWLALMQHHGAPTRLLDWSYSPYVALYFAVTSEPAHDAALWYFDGDANWMAIAARLQVPTDATFDYQVLPAARLTRPEDAEPFLFSAIMKMRSAREIAQQGAFTFCDHLLADHQEALVRQLPQRCGKIRIPAALKHEFWARLRKMNITPSALFPGVDGVCLAIREELARLAPTPSPPVAD
jgi:hypothetical protein